jgi:hypothetical protein
MDARSGLITSCAHLLHLLIGGHAVPAVLVPFLLGLGHPLAHPGVQQRDHRRAAGGDRLLVRLLAGLASGDELVSGQPWRAGRGTKHDPRGPDVVHRELLHRAT